MQFLYVDATSGGMVLQVVLSGFVGGIVVFKLFWRSVLNTVLRRGPTETDTPAESQATEIETPAA
jgi:hypothetical protein